MSKFKSLKGTLGIGLALIVLQALSVVPANAQVDIYVLGRPGSTFSPHSARNLEEMKDLFDRFEDDIRIVLEKGGWGGNADDVFITMRAAQEGDGTVTKTTIAPGHTLKWMANRKGGQPSVIMNPRWAAKEPMPAWKILVESNGSEYTFIVPVSCMNLALDSSKAMPKPSCSIKASYDAATDMITVTGSSDGEFKITDAGLPGGKGSVSDLKSTGPMSWTFMPKTDGTYTFNAESIKDGQKVTCTASVLVGKAKAACAIDVTVDPDTRIITVDTSRSQGDFEMTALSLPDGSAGDLAAMMSAGDSSWTFDPSATLKKKPGDYTYTFAGKSTLNDSESVCDTAAIIRIEGPDFRWIARGYYVHVWPGSDTLHVENPVGLDPPVFTQFWVDGGNGFGGEVEWMWKPAIGLWGGVTFANMKTNLMYDRGDVWLNSDDRVDMRQFNLGLNYHFLPGRRFDIFAGVFASWVGYSSSTFNFSEIPPEFGGPQNYQIKYDDELTYGLNLGADFAFSEGSPWVITGGLRYLGADLEGDNNVYALNVDPLQGFIGIGYRW
ncbi:MAG: hypothetical protein WBQ27_00610 [Thermoanaerobaculia bacterium]